MINIKRTVPATILKPDSDGNYPETGTPGASCNMYEDHLTFNCPGCGRLGSIVATHPKTGSPSWDIVEGQLSDPSTLSLTPSINCVGCCGWHGYLTKGVFVSC